MVAMVTRPESLNGVLVPYGSSVETLREELSAPGPQAWAACIALGASDDPTALETLIALTQSADWRYRRVAIEAISLHEDARTVANRVMAALSDPSPFVLRTACHTAAGIGLQAAHDALVRLLRDSDPATREVAVDALATVWEPGHFQEVLDLYRQDPEQRVRRAAAWTLYQTASHENWRVLLREWVTDRLPRHRAWACQLVEKFGCAADADSVQPLAHDSDGHVRNAALRAITEVQNAT